MAQQTAVEWLVEQLKEYDFTSTNGVIKIPTWVLTKIKEQAKQMEKEQLHKCASFWREKECEIEKQIFDQYYTETYVK